MTRRALALALLGAAACSRATEGSKEESPVARVTVVRPQREEIARTITLAASVEAYEQAPVYAKVPGYVETIAVDIGDRVEAGQVLATLDMPEVAQQYAEAESRLAEQRAELARADAEAALQRTLLERSRGLRAKDAITEQDLDQARAAGAKAAAELDLGRARARSAEARLGELRALMEYGRLRAPFAGVVTRRFVDRGALVQAATSSSGVSPVVIVARTDMLRVVADVPEPDAPFVDRNNPAVLEVAALPGRRVAGRIARFAGALDPGSRTMRTEVDVPNPDGALRPGMYGTLAIDLETHPEALTVPEGAVRQAKTGATLYALAGERAAERRVKTGLAAGGRVEILEGLADGEPVIASGAAALSDGARVQVTE